ncbi:MAG: M48 family metallopeptidase [Gammaproteobacteria bacterium]|nr:M48 family metallopeptidase [Gammaproteobacteria bacterium]
MTADLVTTLFSVFLGLSVLLQIWLAHRQIRHVSAHRDRVPEGFDEVISHEAHVKAADYTCANQRFGLVQLTFATLILLGWTVGGGLDRLNDGALRFFGGDESTTASLLYPVTLVVLFTLVGSILELPFEWYRNFRIEEKFGFNRMTHRLWLTDVIKNTLLSIVIGVPLIAAVLWLMGAAGPMWWLWAWALWMAFNLLLMVIYPLFIAPLFNEFKPLEDEGLRARVNELMQRCGFSAKGLFVMDGSKRSAQSNAYFTGIGRSKRVVFYDTLLAQLSAGELEAVLAHELGHFHHKHIMKLIVGLFVMSLIGLATLGWLAQQPAFYLGLGVTPNASASNDALALLLFLLVLPCVSVVLGPLSSGRSRQYEFQADAYAKKQSSGTDLSTALVKLTEDNASTLTPDPWYVRFNYSHPPVIERLAALRSG